MTKEERIKWRLGERPTVEGITKLVDKSILTKDEAREILFSSETTEDRDKKSLQSEIKFLRELVEKLSSRSEIITTIREIEKPVYLQRDWYHQYDYWCNTGRPVSYTIGDMMCGTSSGLAGDTTEATGAINFSQIEM